MYVAGGYIYCSNQSQTVMWGIRFADLTKLFTHKAPSNTNE